MFARRKDHKPIHSLFITSSLVFLLLPIAVFAGEDNFLDRAGDWTAEKIDQGAEKLDVLLAGKRYVRKKNDSQISIKQLTVLREGGVHQDSTSFGLNIRLPNLERRWSLRFSSYDEEAEKRDLRERRFRTRPRENDPGAALLFFKQLGAIKTTFQPRLALKDPLEMRYLLRFEAEAKTTPIRINPKLEFFADPKKGVGEYFQLNFSYNLTKRYELSFLNEEEYRERDNLLNVNHAVAIDYALSDLRGMGFTVSQNSNNRKGGYHMESYAFSPTYAQELKTDRLRYVTGLFWNFPKTERYKGNIGGSLQVEVLF